MSRFFELPIDIANQLWSAVTSTPSVLSSELALAIRKALEASTAAAPVPPAAVAVPTPWGTATPPAVVHPLVAAKTLHDLQQGLADAAPPGKGNPPPIIPAHVFNPVLSLIGAKQVWYYDEPNGGWPAASADQTPKEGVRGLVATSPLTGYYADKAAIDAMPAPFVTPEWDAAEQRMREAVTAPVAVDAGNAPV